MSSRTEGRRDTRAPWRPSAAQARLLSAILARPTPGADPLDAWCRQEAAAIADEDARMLLPFALARLASLQAPAPTLRLAESAYRDNARLNLMRVGRLLDVLRRLEAADIPTVVLKGAALLFRRCYTFGMRPMGDVDILVRPDDAIRAAAQLTDLGWTADGSATPRGLQTRMRMHHALSFSLAPMHSLDLHWRVASIGPPDVHDLLRDAAVTVAVCATDVRVLAPTDQVFHLVVHAAQPGWTPSPRWMVDVHTMLTTTRAQVDWERLVDLARRTSTTARVRAALADVGRVAPGLVPCEVETALASRRVPAWERHELASFERMPPYSVRDVARWHWCLFRRLRTMDPQWSRWPLVVGLADYVRLKRRTGRRA